MKALVSSAFSAASDLEPLSGHTYSTFPRRSSSRRSVSTVQVGHPQPRKDAEVGVQKQLPAQDATTTAGILAERLRGGLLAIGVR
jgi:hypothetical protein